MAQHITTIDDLIREYYGRNPDGHFFDHRTLKFFGERISEMRLLKGVWKVTDISGRLRRCYIVSSRQRKAYGEPRRKWHYFEARTLRQIFIPNT